MPVARLALAGAAAAVALTGCSQPSTANDNRDSQRSDRPLVQPTVLRTPVKVDEAPVTVPLPGPTGGPQEERSTGHGGGSGAETSEHGPDGT